MIPILYEPIRIVFVHQGSSLPLHLLLNLYRTAEIFPDNEVWLIFNHESLSNNLWPRREKIELDERDMQVRDAYGFPRDLRNNFWFNSLSRFSLISKFQKLYEGPILHIESDVVISSDFPLNKFSDIQTEYAFPIVSSSRAIASTLYLKNSTAAQELWNYSISRVNRNPLSSDMEILHQLWIDSPESVTLLPTAPECLKEKNLKSASDDQNIQFGGFFDGHDFGWYVAGTNPWNKGGISDLHSKIDGSLLSFSQDNIIYDEVRKFVSLREPKLNYDYKLFSLHVTNKTPFFFSRKLSSLALKFWVTKLRDTEKTFHPLVFILMGIKFTSRRLKVFIGVKP